MLASCRNRECCVVTGLGLRLSCWGHDRDSSVSIEARWPCVATEILCRDKVGFKTCSVLCCDMTFCVATVGLQCGTEVCRDRVFSVVIEFSLSRQGRLTWCCDTVFGVATGSGWLAMSLPSARAIEHSACITGHQRAR